MRIATLAAALLLLPTLAMAQARPAELPSPEQAAINDLVQQVGKAHSEMAVSQASLAAIRADMARERVYWQSYVAGLTAKP